MGAGSTRGRRLAPSEAVLGLVETCGRRAALAHVARVLCLAAFVGLVVLALVVARGRSVLDTEALGLGLLVGGLGFVAWVRTVRYDAPRVARRIDRAFPASGLLASFEATRRGARTELRELIALRAYLSVPRRRALERTVPVAVPYIVLPLAGAVALVFAVQWRDAHAGASSHVLALEALSGELGTLGAAPGTALDPDVQGRVDALAAEVEAALAAAREADGSNDVPAARTWAEELEALATEADGELAEALRELAFDAEWIAPGADANEGDTSPGAGERAAESMAAADPGEAPAEGDVSEGRAPEGAADGAAPARPVGDPASPGRSEVAAGASAPTAEGPAVDGPGNARGGADGSTGGPTSVDGAGEGSRPPDEDPARAPAVAGPPPLTPPARHAAIVRAWLDGGGH